MDMGAALPEEDMPIAEYLVGSLDDKGYLAVKVEDVAYELDVDGRQGARRAARAAGPGAGRHRRAQPARVPARSRSPTSKSAACRSRTRCEIVTQFLTELGEHKFGRIAHELKISQQEVADVWEFVKTKLNPHPAHGFSPTNASDRDTRAMYIIPDVVIIRRHRRLRGRSRREPALRAARQPDVHAPVGRPAPLAARR